MDYLLLAYGATVLVMGLAAWRLRSGLRQAEADLLAAEPESPDGPERVADGA